MCLLAGEHALVADFGIARALAEQGPPDPDRYDHRHAALHVSWQCMGADAIDARSDQYALACIVYEMFTGTPPFTGDSVSSIIAKRLTNPVPDLRAMRPDLAQACADAVARALAREPGARFATATAFVSALESGHPTPIGATDGAKRGRTRWWHSLAFVAVLGAATVASVLWWRQPSTGGTAASTPRLAVLPFENEGRPEDAYIADGFSDELRGKLTSVPGVEVIARASSSRLSGSAKPLDQIAQELGVRYLLMGTVRWSGRGEGGTVRVSPELIEVSSRGGQGRGGRRHSTRRSTMSSRCSPVSPRLW